MCASEVRSIHGNMLDDNSFMITTNIHLYGCFKQPYVSRYRPYNVPYETPNSCAAFFISKSFDLIASITRLVNVSSQNCGRRPLAR